MKIKPTMTLLEFLRNLDESMDEYLVDLTWVFENYCPECKKTYQTEDEEYCVEGQPVGDYRISDKNRHELHHIGYPFLYNTPIDKFTITISDKHIKALYYVCDANYEQICDKCNGYI